MVEPPLRLTDVGFDAEGRLTYPQRETPPAPALAEVLQRAEEQLRSAAPPQPATAVPLSFEDLRWFELPPQSLLAQG